MRVLLTGATGYLGSSVASALVSWGHHVEALVRDAHADRVSALRELGVQVTQGTLGQQATLVRAITAAEAVVHTAWDATDPVAADVALFDAIRDTNKDGRLRHLLQTSGCSVYGAHAHAHLDPDTPVDPASQRGRIEGALNVSGIPCTVLRPGMIFGRDSRSSIIGRWFAHGVRGEAKVPGRPDKVWSWVHVDDVADAYCRVLIDPVQHESRTYLLADDVPTPVRVVVEAAARLAGQQDVTAAPESEEAEQYRIFDRDEVLRSHDAENNLGWVPEHQDVLHELPASWAAWTDAQHTTT